MLITVAGCEKTEVEKSITVFDNDPDEIVNSVYTIQTNGEKTERTIVAKKFMRYYENKVSIADSLTITDFNEEGVFEYSIYCDSAFIDEKENVFNAYGNVFVKNVEATLQTEYLQWNRNTNKLYAPGFVSINRDKSILNGYELKTSMNLENFEMKQVKAEGDLREEDIDL